MAVRYTASNTASGRGGSWAGRSSRDKETLARVLRMRRAVQVVSVVALLVVVVLLFLILNWYVAPTNPSERKGLVSAVALPAALALGGIYFAERRAVIDREIARRHAEDGELRTYFEQMGKLLLGQDTPKGTRLRETGADSDIRYLARAWTTSTLEKLTGENRKRRLLRFLYESHLIDKGRPVVSLARARLQETNLEDAILTEAALSGAWLDKAKLGNAKLMGADLSKADLSRANLSKANLGGGKMEDSLGGGKVKVNLLKGADLSSANLTNANLSGACLGSVDVDGTYLPGANLSNATVDDAQLAQCKTLEGATMPNGQKYEDWLKDKESRGEHLTDRQKACLESLKDEEGRGEDGENRHPS
jgi:hypothetical protein